MMNIPSVKLGIVAFIIPFMFVYDDSLLLQSSSIIHTVNVVLFAVIGVFSLASGLQGWLQGTLIMPLRICLILSGLLLIHPAWQTDLVGFITLGAVYLFQRFRTRR